MIKLIVGLGNPGQRYAETRHNVGFWFVDNLAQGAWQFQSRFNGDLSEVVIAGNKVILLKPRDFMNCSGVAVGKVTRYFKLEPEQILVVHDELDFMPATIKLKKEGGHAGHNGLRDIIAHLGSKSFYRLRVGIGRPAVGSKVADFVLSAPSKKEKEGICFALDLAANQLPEIVIGKMAEAMEVLHARC